MHGRRDGVTHQRRPLVNRAYGSRDISLSKAWPRPAGRPAGRPLILRFLVYISRNSLRASRSLVINLYTSGNVCILAGDSRWIMKCFVFISFFVTSSLVFFPRPALNKFFSISYMLYSVLGFVGTFVVGIIVSLLTGKWCRSTYFHLIRNCVAWVLPEGHRLSIIVRSCVCATTATSPRFLELAYESVSHKVDFIQ